MPLKISASLIFSSGHNFSPNTIILQQNLKMTISAGGDALMNKTENKCINLPSAYITFKKLFILFEIDLP